MNKESNNYQINKGEVHVWYSWIDLWQDKIDIFLSLLSPDEIERGKRFIIRERGNDFITQKGLVRLLLSEYLDQNPEDIIFSTTKTGKPYISGGGINFNISHSGNLLMCGISPDLTLGIDIQQIYALSPLDRMIQKVCSNTEIQLLNSLPKSDRLDHFFTVWTAKEAFLKASGEGFYLSPNQFSIYQIEEEGLSLKYAVDQKKSTDKDWTILELNIDPGYKAILASNGRINDIKTELFST